MGFPYGHAAGFEFVDGTQGIHGRYGHMNGACAAVAIAYLRTLRGFNFWGGVCTGGCSHKRISATFSA